MRGQSLKLSFYLRAACAGTACAMMHKACLPNGQCDQLTPMPPDPDLAAPADQAGPPPPDLAGSPDLATGPGMFVSALFRSEKGVTSATLDPPDGLQPNDLIIAMVLLTKAPPRTVTPASGVWSIMGNNSLGASTQGILLARTAGTTEDSDPDLFRFDSPSGPGDMDVAIVAYRGLSMATALPAQSHSCTPCSVAEPGMPGRAVTFVWSSDGKACSAPSLPPSLVHLDPFLPWLVIDPIVGTGPWDVTCASFSEALFHGVLAVE